jgi:hypothetical protein
MLREYTQSRLKVTKSEFVSRKEEKVCRLVFSKDNMGKMSQQ